MLTVGLCFAALILLILLGFPIFVAICMVGGAATLLMGYPISLVITNIFGGIDHFSLMAIPLFILAGFIMSECNITSRVVDFSDSLVGRFKGSLGHVNILSSMFFAGIQGSGVADASAIGTIMIPAMEKQGYAKDYAVAVTASSSAIGPIIPPSIAMIMFAYYTDMSVGKLFLGGLVPGIVIGAGLMIVNAIASKRFGYDQVPSRHTLKMVLSTFRRSIGALMMPVIIITGIISGKITPTESGAAAVIYGLIYGLASRNMKVSRIPAVLIRAARTTAIVMIILAVSKTIAVVMEHADFKETLTTYLVDTFDNRYLATLGLMTVLVFMGLFIDPAVLIVMFARTTAEVGAQLGFEPVHFGVLMVITMLLGAVTPPVGSMLFVSCSIAKLPIEKSIRILLPFLAVLFAVAVLVLFVPQIVLFMADFAG